MDTVLFAAILDYYSEEHTEKNLKCPNLKFVIGFSFLFC